MRQASLAAPRRLSMRHQHRASPLTRDDEVLRVANGGKEAENDPRTAPGVEVRYDADAITKWPRKDTNA